MVTEKQLYKVVKLQLPDGYNLVPKFGFAKTNDNLSGDINIVKNTLAVYFKNANKPYRVASGHYLMNSRRVIFNLYTDRASETAISNGYEILDKIKTNMLSLKNTEVNIGTVLNPENITIIDCEIGVDSNYIGFSEQGQAIFSLELKITY